MQGLTHPYKHAVIYIRDRLYNLWGPGIKWKVRVPCSKRINNFEMTTTKCEALLRMEIYRTTWVACPWGQPWSYPVTLLTYHVSSTQQRIHRDHLNLYAVLKLPFPPNTDSPYLSHNKLAKKTLISEVKTSVAYKALLCGFSPLISKSYYLQSANKQAGKVTQGHTTYFFLIMSVLYRKFEKYGGRESIYYP